MEILDLMVQIEKYVVNKGIDKESTTVSELMDEMKGDAIDEL